MRGERKVSLLHFVRIAYLPGLLHCHYNGVMLVQLSFVADSLAQTSQGGVRSLERGPGKLVETLTGFRPVVASSGSLIAGMRGKVLKSICGIGTLQVHASYCNLPLLIVSDKLV